MIDFFLGLFTVNMAGGSSFYRSGESHGDGMMRFSSQNSRHSRDRRQRSAAVCCIQMTKCELRVDNRCAKIRAVAALHTFTLTIFDRQGSETCPNIGSQAPPSVSTGWFYSTHFPRERHVTRTYTLYTLYRSAITSALRNWICWHMKLAIAERIGAVKAEKHFKSFLGDRKEKKLHFYWHLSALIVVWLGSKRPKTAAERSLPQAGMPAHYKVCNCCVSHFVAVLTDLSVFFLGVNQRLLWAQLLV